MILYWFRDFDPPEHFFLGGGRFSSFLWCIQANESVIMSCEVYSFDETVSKKNQEKGVFFIVVGFLEEEQTNHQWSIM